MGTLFVFCGQKGYLVWRGSPCWVTFCAIRQPVSFCLLQGRSTDTNEHLFLRIWRDAWVY